jgi:hypothetical protein
MFNVHYNVHLKFDIIRNLTAGNFYAFSRPFPILWSWPQLCLTCNDFRVLTYVQFDRPYNVQVGTAGGTGGVYGVGTKGGPSLLMYILIPYNVHFGVRKRRAARCEGGQCADQRAPI